MANVLLQTSHCHAPLSNEHPPQHFPLSVSSSKKAFLRLFFRNKKFNPSVLPHLSRKLTQRLKLPMISHHWIVVTCTLLLPWVSQHKVLCSLQIMIIHEHIALPVSSTLHLPRCNHLNHTYGSLQTSLLLPHRNTFLCEVCRQLVTISFDMIGSHLNQRLCVGCHRSLNQMFHPLIPSTLLRTFSCLLIKLSIQSKNLISTIPSLKLPLPQ